MSRTASGWHDPRHADDAATRAYESIRFGTLALSGLDAAGGTDALEGDTAVAWLPVSLDEEIETGEDSMPREVEDWGPSPEERYEQTELGSILSTVIGELDPSFRIVFQLRDIEQLSTEETAEALDLSVPAVKSRLLRARLKLRQKLGRYFQRGGNS